jgi:hypothetical protein
MLRCDTPHACRLTLLLPLLLLLLLLLLLCYLLLQVPGC